MAAFQRDQQKLPRYSYREHVLTRKDNTRDGRTLEVWYVHGRPVNETIALDSRALNPGEIAAEHARFCQRMAAAAKRSPPPLGELEFAGHSYPFARLAHDYVYRNRRTIVWHGRTSWVYDAVPNPAVHARSREETLLLHSAGEVYVDAADEHLVRLALHSTSTVRYGLGVLADIHQASFAISLRRFAPRVWLPAQTDFHLRATVLLLGHIIRGKRQSFFDYSILSGSTAAAAGCSR
ncbi:MAG: hypothetical protein ACRD04_11475 [Terriglobales bacterium]